MFQQAILQDSPPTFASSKNMIEGGIIRMMFLKALCARQSQAAPGAN
jgi:hypothetical protein